MKIKRIAILASGSGSNAVKMIEYFKSSKTIKAALLLTNNATAGVLEKTSHQIEQFIINNEQANDGILLTEIMKSYEIDYIILAGYLRKIPELLIESYPHHIINIHPALLPKYGGKGMYGMNVHTAVKENKELESGITIHLVNQNYDEGKILAQFTTPILPEDSPEKIQQKVLKLEHENYSKTVESYILEDTK